MKLSTNITSNDVPTSTKLNYICGNYVCEKHIDKSIQLLFIESIEHAIQLNLINEAAIGKLVNTLASKVQSAANPQASEDLGNLLLFMAPQGGGLKEI